MYLSLMKMLTLLDINASKIITMSHLFEFIIADEYYWFGLDQWKQ